MTHEEELQQKLDKFLIAGAEINLGHRAWLRFSFGEIYFRKSYRAMPPGPARFLDVATVSLYKKYRGQGIFTKLLPCIEQAAPQHGLQGVYVECIMTIRFRQFFLRNGYLDRLDQPGDVYKRIVA